MLAGLALVRGAGVAHSTRRGEVKVGSQREGQGGREAGGQLQGRAGQSPCAPLAWDNWDDFKCCLSRWPMLASPALWETELGGLQVQVQPGQRSDTPRSSLQGRTEKGW